MATNYGIGLSFTNRPFLSSLGPLFQNEVKCSAFDMEMIFHSHANKTHFHKKGCVPSLILKVKVFGTQKWPIVLWIPQTRDQYMFFNLLYCSSEIRNMLRSLV